MRVQPDQQTVRDLNGYWYPKQNKKLLVHQYSTKYRSQRQVIYSLSFLEATVGEVASEGY